MAQNPCFLIVDGYPKVSRDEFDQCGVPLAWRLYGDMLRRHLPEATYDVWLASDTPELPDGKPLDAYTAVLWTGCNLTVYHHHDARVRRQLELARRAYEIGTPGFGSCWGLQLAAVAAGGEVAANPRGREMGLARKIHLTADGAAHPMMRGKPPVFDGYISHDDEVVALPPGAVHLASNDFTRVQAIAVQHGKGVFWATQYHPEYDLMTMARLIVARAPKLLREGFFTDRPALDAFSGAMEALARQPDRKDLRWQLAVDDDVLDLDLKQVEFANWLQQVVLPSLAG